MTSSGFIFARQMGHTKKFLSTLVVAAIGIALSVFGWFAVAAWEDRLAEQTFSTSAADHAQALQTGLDEYLHTLAALRAFFDASSQGVTRDEFRSFTKDVLDDRKAILSFTWVPRVMRDERGAHELAGAREGIADYHIKSVGPTGQMSPTPEQDEYFPVYYSIEPLTARIYGINLKDGGIRQEAIDRARDGDQQAATRNIVLQLGTGSRDGFLVVMPVYRRNAVHDTLEDRRANLMGFVQGVFQFNAMVDAILVDMKTPLNILLFESDAKKGDLPVHVRGEDAERMGAMTMGSLSASKNWTGDLRAADRHWRVVVTPPVVASTLSRYNRAWVVLLAGLLVTGWVAAYMWISIRSVHRLQVASNAASALAEAASVLAHSDALTGLPNRRAFVEHLTRAFAAVAHGGAPFAVHLLDLDEFKDINDTQGHAVGDGLLKEAASRIMASVRSVDFVARLGGDEFAVIQANVTDPSAAGSLAETIALELAAPYVANGVEMCVTASIGIAIHSDNSVGAKEIMMQADLALYRAKDDGRSCYRFHTGELDQQVHLRVNLAKELREGIDRGELRLYYQPQVEIRTGRIIGLEALARWTHPTRGEIRPSIFIPIAERTGVILALGRWVLASACRQVREWEDAGFVVPLVAVNVSGAQLRRAQEFERDVAENFAKWGIRKHAIELEITESVLMEATERQSDALEGLRKLGVTISIDDFGTGYSSLRYLTAYPVNRLKIAQELVAGINLDSRSAVVVRSAIHLAQDLGIECIAEGVESEDQARFLLGLGCKYAQGYHFGRPMPAANIPNLLRQRVDMANHPLPPRKSA